MCGDLLFVEPVNLWVNNSLYVIKDASVELDLSKMAEYIGGFGYKA